jgi:hypothetical protein
MQTESGRIQIADPIETPHIHQLCSTLGTCEAQGEMECAQNSEAEEPHKEPILFFRAIRAGARDTAARPVTAASQRPQTSVRRTEAGAVALSGICSKESSGTKALSEPPRDVWAHLMLKVSRQN